MAEKKPYQYKRDCHRMMEDIWGWNKPGRASAYLWLKKEFGREIHFSEIHDLPTLETIHARLFTYSVLMDNKKMIEETAPAWDAWIENKSQRRGKRFNRRRSKHIAGERGDF